MADEKTEKAPKGDKAEKAAKGGDKRRAKSENNEPRAKVITTVDVQAARFHGKYTKDVIPALTKQFGYKNPNQVPKLQKIVINMGLGAAVTNPKIVDAAVEELRA